ncbi:MAG: dTDP-4-dehydrorhamnose reductase [Rickettsiales bacterium]|nr:dTDP-4-dehydrorhamnose reductase [Rickettsiales bacterium]
MTDKILITGAGGQLGTSLTKLLPEAILTDKNELDITNENDVNSFVKNNNINIIINCAAYTNVDKAEEETDLAEQINTVGAKNLAETGRKIIHISTDYVFDGQNNIPYKTEDKPSPISIYGKTKLAGEKEVLKNPQSVVIRTAWLYSSYGKNFVKTMLKLGSEKEQITVVNDQIGTPTYARDLAKAIVDILPQINTKTSGIYHFTNEGVCSWYDFATEIMHMANKKCKVLPISSSEYPTKATRPNYSLLDKSKIKNTFNINIRHWRQALVDCLKELENE